MTYNLVTVTGSFPGKTGTVTFTPPSQVTDLTGTTPILGPASLTYALSGGSFTTAALLATDNPSLLPAAWSWTVTVALTGQKPYSYPVLIPAAAGTSQALADLPVAGGGGGSTASGVDWVDVVVAYGADPSGHVDSSAAFTSAFAASKNVYAPAGTFLVNSGISIPPGGTLRGAGVAVTILRCTAVNVNVVAVNGTTGLGEVEFPVAENFAIAGPGSGTGYGLYVSWSTATSAFSGIAVTSAGSHGVYVTNTYNSTFTNISVSGSGGDGFHAVTNVNSCTFVNCLSASNTAGAGFSLNGGAGTQFTGCTAEANHGHGFTLTGMIGGGVYGGDSEGNGTDTTSANVYIGAGSSAVQVSGMSLNGDAVTVVNVEDDGGTNTLISGNAFSPAAVGGNDIVLTSNAVRTRMASNSALGHSLTVSDSSGTGVYDTGANIASLLSGPSTSSDNGYICQNFDPGTTSVNVSSGMPNYTAGQVFLSRIDLRQAIPAGKKLYFWWVQGAGGTTSNLNCYIAAFSSSGTQIGSTSADLHSTASSLQSVTLPALAPQSLYGAVMIGTQQSGSGLTNAAGLMYSLGAMGLVSSNFALGDGLGTSSYRCARQLTGQTSMPGSLTMSSNVVSILYFWLGIGA